MAITDLLDRIPFSPPRAPRAPRPAEPGPDRTFEIELPPVERVGDDGPVGPPLAGVELDDPYFRPPAEGEAPARGARPARPRAGRGPLPSWGAAVIGGLALLCLALAATLAAVVSGDAPAAAAPVEVPPGQPEAGPVEPAGSPASYSADPAPIPVDLLTRLEEASDEPLDVELSRLLEAIQHGFGRRSARLEPTLRSYVYRMASRFDWNPDTFRVAVTAPDADLAAARGALLEQLFADAVAAGRLEVGTGVGPHGVSLVSAPSSTD